MTKQFEYIKNIIMKKIKNIAIKVFTSYLMIIGIIGSLQAQDTLTIGNSYMKLLGGVPMYINGTILNNSSYIFNSGNIYIKGNIINNHTSTLFSNGEQGSVIFIGDTLQQVGGTNPVRFNKIRLEKNDSLRLSQNITVSDSVIFIKGIINLNGKDLYLDNSDNNQFGVLDKEKDTARVVGKTGGYVWSDLPVSKYLSQNNLGLGLRIDNIGNNIKIERGHTSELTVTDGSIEKYYNLYPTNTTNTFISINYLDSVDFDDVNCTESDFKLWTSQTDGYYYENKYGSVDIAGDSSFTTSQLIPLQNPMRITVADAECDNPPIIDLGSDTMHICSGNSDVINAGNTGSDFMWNTGETTQTIYISTEGNYIVTVTDPKGCYTIDSIQVILDSIPHPEFTTIDGSSFKCAGKTFTFTNTSTIDVSGTPMTYLWEFGDGYSSTDSATSHTYLTAGDYTVTLTAVSHSGCDVSATKSITVKPLPEVAFTFNNVCSLEPIAFTNTTAGTIMSQDWNFGDGNTASISNPSHTYSGTGDFNVTLTIQNNYGCIDSLTQIASIYDPPIANFTIEDAEVCEGNSSVFHNASTSTGGSLTYEWDFDNGMNSTTANPIILYDNYGTYNVQLIAISGNACSDSITKQVVVSPRPVANFTFNDVCLGDTTNFVNTTTITPSETITYEWNFGDGTSSTNTNFNKIYSTQGSYTVSLIATSASGCVTSTNKTVNVYPNPTANFICQPVCEYDASVFQNNSYPNDGTLNYQWNFDDGNILTENNPNYTYANDGIYNVELIAISVYGCTDTIHQNVIVYPAPIVDIGDTIYHCYDTYILDAQNSGMNYLWSTNAQSQTITVYADGEYSVTVTSADGCSSADSAYVYLSVPVTIDLGGDIIDACDSIRLDAGYPGADYIWSTGETTRTILVLNSGNYAVTVTNQGCTGDTSAVVNIHQSPIVDLGADITVCDGTVVTLDAQNSGANFEWSTTQTTQTINVTSANEYWVAVIDANSCITYDTINVIFNPLPVLNFPTDTTVCGSLLLDAHNTGSTYMWNNTSTNQTLLANTSGQYWVEVTAGNNCSLSDTVNITVNPIPMVDIGNDTAICNGEILVLNAENSGSNYLWQTGVTTQTLQVSASADYWVSITNSYNCVYIDTIHINVNPSPIVNLGGNKFLCSNQSVLLNAGDDGTEYLWNSSNGFTSTNNSVIVADSGKYWVDVANPYGCISSDTISVQYSDLSITSYFLAASEAKIGDTLMFVDVSYPTPSTFLWDFGDGVTSEDSLPSHIYYIEHDFNVLLTVSNNFCSDTISKTVHIEGTNKWYAIDDSSVVIRPESMFEILSSKIYPNPNNGRFIFEMELNEQADVDLYLYNLNGQIIYNEKICKASYLLKSYSFEGLQPGIYIYRMLVKDKVRTFKVVKYNN